MILSTNVDRQSRVIALQNLTSMAYCRFKLKEIIGDVNIYIMSFMKLLIIPGITLLIMHFFFKDTSLLSKVLIMSFAMPAAACTTIFSEQYNADVGFATKGVLLSTMLSVGTISIFAMLLK